MKFSQLLADLPPTLISFSRVVRCELEISGIHSDSRKVQQGGLFVAIPGVELDGHSFIPAALQSGAAAVVGQKPESDVFPQGAPVPYVCVANSREALAWLSAAWHGYPARKLRVIGVTGTDGKTTTVRLIASILQAAGYRVGWISTVNALIGAEEIDTGFHTTTPDAPDIQRYLARMVELGTQYAVIEATSHGLEQQRVTACEFDVAVVTNITHEHLDYHGTFAEYRAAKAKLFRSLGESYRKPDMPKIAILNADDSSYDYLRSQSAEPCYAYGIQAPSDVQAATASCGLCRAATASCGLCRAATASCVLCRAATASCGLCRAADIQLSPAGASFRAVTPQGEFDVKTSLIGTFNVYNILAAIAAGVSQGLSEEAMRQGILAVKGVTGRMERIDLGQDFATIIDFAHTPNALEKALQTVRTLTRCRVIVVFGCAGLRDRTKRRLMGEVAGRLADRIFLTAEDPRTEDVNDIIGQIATGCERVGRREGVDYSRVPDRAEAIAAAVNLAQAGDLVIVTGKGHERSMCFGTTEYPWSEHEAVTRALQERLGHTLSLTP
jgi:UDP-N-acetylmuramoyl-L-alanyl-D-glutamate--2,6-diaminopimelate ligase